MKLLARGVSLVVGGVLYLSGSVLGWGVRLNTPAPEEFLAAGEALQISGVLLIFLIWFHWRQTAVTGPSWPKHRPVIATSFVVLGILTIGILYAMLHWAVFSEAGTGPELIKEMLLRRFDSLGATLAVALAGTSIATGVGLYLDKGWARVMAKLIALPYSAGWPVGLVVAIYTWWALNPNRSLLLEGQETAHVTPPRPVQNSKALEAVRQIETPQDEVENSVPIMGSSNPLVLIMMVVAVPVALLIALILHSPDEALNCSALTAIQI